MLTKFELGTSRIQIAGVSPRFNLHMDLFVIFWLSVIKHQNFGDVLKICNFLSGFKGILRTTGVQIPT
jgi:hypothetical protein